MGTASPPICEPYSPFPSPTRSFGGGISAPFGALLSEEGVTPKLHVGSTISCPACTNQPHSSHLSPTDTFWGNFSFPQMSPQHKGGPWHLLHRGEHWQGFTSAHEVTMTPISPTSAPQAHFVGIAPPFGSLLTQSWSNPQISPSAHGEHHTDHHHLRPRGDTEPRPSQTTS